MSLDAISTRDVLLRTSDIEAAAVFYEKLLGLTVFMREETMIGLETGGFRLFLDKAALYGPVFEFKVADLTAAKLQLVAAGCRIENDDPTVPRCYVRDPYGLIFNVAEKP